MTHSDWTLAMQDAVADIHRRDQSCQRLAMVATDSAEKDRLTAKSQGYAHAAEILAAAIRDAQETP